MLTLDFPGSRKLIDAIDAAVSQDTTRAVTDSLRNSLCSLIRSQTVTLPECVFETAEGRYARRELYRSEDHGYCVVAMTWGPGQGTPSMTTAACGAWKAYGAAHWKWSSTSASPTKTATTASSPWAPSRPAPAPPAA